MPESKRKRKREVRPKGQIKSHHMFSEQGPGDREIKLICQQEKKAAAILRKVKGNEFMFQESLNEDLN